MKEQDRNDCSGEELDCDNCVSKGICVSCGGEVCEECATYCYPKETCSVSNEGWWCRQCKKRYKGQFKVNATKVRG